jgi:hypothetical protein
MNAPDAQAAMKEVERKANEKALEATLRAYILDSVGPYKNKTYQFGGLINLLYTVQKIADDLAESADDLGCNQAALEFASKQIEDAAYAIDSNYVSNL